MTKETDLASKQFRRLKIVVIKCIPLINTRQYLTVIISKFPKFKATTLNSSTA